MAKVRVWLSESLRLNDQVFVHCFIVMVPFQGVRDAGSMLHFKESSLCLVQRLPVIPKTVMSDHVSKFIVNPVD